MLCYHAPDQPDDHIRMGLVTMETDAAARTIRNSFNCIAHRGASAYEPENTIASFTKAFDLGADGIECDVQRSRDGHLVIIHDGTVDRTTDGTGYVAEMTLAELRTLRIRGDSHNRLCIPVLDEVLGLVVSGERFLNLEIKGESPQETHATARAVAAKLAMLTPQARARLLVSSFEHASLLTFHAVIPDVRIAPLFGSDWRNYDMVRRARQIGASAIHPAVRLVTPDLISRAHEAGLQVNAWTANRLPTLRELLRLGVDGVFTDYPDRAIALRNSLKQV